MRFLPCSDYFESHSQPWQLYRRISVLCCYFISEVADFLWHQDGSSSTRTLDLASILEDGSASRAARDAPAAADSVRSILLIAFQFPYEEHLQESVAAMARQYVRGIVSSVQRISMAISSSWLGSHPPQKLTPGSPEALTLAHWICRSYRQAFSPSPPPLLEKIRYQ